MDDTPFIVIDLAHSKGFRKFKSTTYFSGMRHTTIFQLVLALSVLSVNRYEISLVPKDDKSLAEVSALRRENRIYLPGIGWLRPEFLSD